MRPTRRLRDSLFVRLLVLLAVVLVLCEAVAGRFFATAPPALPLLPPPATGPAWRAAPTLPPPVGGGERLFAGPWQDPWPLTASAPLETPWTDRWPGWLLRGVLILAAAAFGAHWLTAPMRRIARAAETLPDAIGGPDAMPVLDERAGAAEQRDTARAFNTMARRLGLRFRERGLFVAAISHDLRAPLARVRVRLEALEHDPLVRRCVADLAEMDDLVDTVLEIFRADNAAEAWQRVDVRLLLRALRDDLVEQRHTVTVRGPSADVVVQAAALRRALANLVGNAARHGGRADITVVDGEGDVTVFIDDQGPGIPAARLDAVFEPFVRLQPAAVSGTGLGLHIARELLRRQGGTVSLANRPEGGLRATVVLMRHRHAPGGP